MGGDKSTEHLEKTELPKFHVEISTGLSVCQAVDIC